MKQIREFLYNQKDIAVMRWLELLKQEEANLVDINYWNERVIHLDGMIKDFENVHGKRNGK